MALPSLPARPVILRIILIVVALITMGVGLHAHYDSGWLSQEAGSHHTYHLYKECNFRRNLSEGGVSNSSNSSDIGTPSCPSIHLERFFVAMTITCFIWAIISLHIVLLGKQDVKELRVMEIALHALFHFLLFLGAIAFIVSAVQSENVYKNMIALGFLSKESGIHLLVEAKIAAAVIAMLQTLLGGWLAWNLLKITLQNQSARSQQVQSVKVQKLSQQKQEDSNSKPQPKNKHVTISESPLNVTFLGHGHDNELSDEHHHGHSHHHHSHKNEKNDKSNMTDQNDMDDKTDKSVKIDKTEKSGNTTGKTSGHHHKG